MTKFLLGVAVGYMFSGLIDELLSNVSIGQDEPPTPGATEEASAS